MDERTPQEICVSLGERTMDLILSYQDKLSHPDVIASIIGTCFVVMHTATGSEDTTCQFVEMLLKQWKESLKE